MSERKANTLFVRLAELGASAQAAIPGLYAWAITVAPAAWSRGAPLLAKVAAVAGLVTLATAPLIENAKRPWAGPVRARLWSVWGLVLTSAVVWALVPSALSSARLDAVRGALGIVGWALFAFASAGPSLRANPETAARIVAGSPLKPRSELPGGDGGYLVAGAVVAIAMQTVGWGVAEPERAVLLRLVTIVSGIGVLGASATIALARHAVRIPASRALRLRRAGAWLVMLVLFVISGVVLSLSRRP